MTRAEKVKRQIDEVLEHRDARVAMLIGDNMRNVRDMLDEQPAAVLEALIEHGNDMQRSGNAPKHRYEFRAAVIRYVEQRLHEARARERQLAQAITGADDLRND